MSLSHLCVVVSNGMLTLKPMPVRKQNVIAILSTLILLMGQSCNKYPLKSPYYGGTGIVIGKETCNPDPTKDYWLVAIASSSSARQQYGDDLILNGVKYSNVIKTTGLAESLKKEGEKIGFDFTIEETATLTANCSAGTPVVYKLKLAQVVSSSPAVF